MATYLRAGLPEVATALSALTGEARLPGNQIGSHWRIGQGALVRWLRGSYGERAAENPDR